jgi:N-acetylglucosamine transport system permease protein
MTMERLRKYLVYTILIGWLCAVALPMGWVLLNSLRSSKEFVQNPFGMPWIVTGTPADGLLEREELVAAIGNPGPPELVNEFGPNVLEQILEKFEELDRYDGVQNGALQVGDRAASDVIHRGSGFSSSDIAHIEAAASHSFARSAAVENYRKAWVESNFSQFFFNSVWVTFWSLFGTLALASMAAYVLARFEFRGNRLLFIFFISGMMIPAQLLLIPVFFEFSWLSELGTQLLQPFGLEFQLYDSHFGLILLYIALSLPFTILVLSGFFKSLPGTLREAAILDGCGEYRVFWHVMLPLAKPGLITAGIFNFLGIWNEYIFALVFVNTPEKKTLPLGLASVSIQAQYKTDFGLMFAGLVIVVIPTLLVYILLQRRLTEGITMGALKG